MTGFGFSLAENTFLNEVDGRYYLFSTVPLRVIRVNRSLFQLIEHIRERGDLSDYFRKNRIDASRVIGILLYLVTRGYLELDTIAGLENCPPVSIIIPVKDQPDEISQCLRSLEDLDYPRDKLEIIVVDDGSESDISELIDTCEMKFIRQERSLGPAASRNNGAARASGEIFAFIDADCSAGKNWLRETVPFFHAAEIGAVGGYVEGYSREKLLDRYEAVSSPLNMGKRLLLEGKSDSTLYVPTANMLVSRAAFEKSGGFNEALHLGEDVDFCWRMRRLGYNMLYVPYGAVTHKHRRGLGRMLARRFEYGTSEAVLYRDHRDRKKTFMVSLFAALSLFALALAILLFIPWPLVAVPVFFGADLIRRFITLGKSGLSYPVVGLSYAMLRDYLSFYYYAFFHLVRYYLILFIGFGFLWPPLWVLGALMLVCTSLVDYYVKKPALKYPFFLFFYLFEHLFYQVGVFWGCFKERYFGSYLLAFKRP